MEAPTLRLVHPASTRWSSRLLSLRRDPRFAAVYRLAESCAYEVVHAHQVTRLALRLFDRTAALHPADHRMRHLLACAAILHDIGYLDGKPGHHKSSLRRIVRSPLLNWSTRRRLVVGSIARYHRKALPRVEHDHFAQLSPADRLRVEQLGGMLRLADGLDRGHQGLVRDLRLEISPRRIAVICRAEDCPEWLDRSARNKTDLLERAMDRQVRVEWE